MPEPNSAPSTDRAPLPTQESHTLLRTMGLFSLVVYGVGDMVGSGIYATIGKAADAMGNAVWLAFLVSMLAAVITGLSYACIASRYPRAAGAAYVTQRAYNFAFLSYLIGLAVTASGLTSMATQTNAFAETLQHMIGGKMLVWGFAFVALMTFINFWGIRESMWTNLVCTTVEVGGLIFIILVGMQFWGGVDYFETPAATLDAAGRLTNHGLGVSMVLSGAVLTFFSFVGFEDMLNVAEEVKAPRKTMPWGIVIAIAIVTLLYIGVSVTAVSVVDYREFSQPGAPLAKISAVAAPWLPPVTFELITLFAVANSMLINYIMGSRLLYGMARHGFLPASLGRVHPLRRTPYVAIFTLFIVVVALAVLGTLAINIERIPAGNLRFSITSDGDGVKTLASSTSLLLLFSFAVVNSALVVLKLRPTEPRGNFEVPIVVPIAGVLVNLTLVGARLTEKGATMKPPLLAAAILAVITALYFVLRPKSIITEESLASLDEDE